MILPIFSLANTGIIGGLVLGKPLGITLLSFVAVSIGICRLPLDLSWKHVFGAGLLGGIGFTMSIFITNLAFDGNLEAINASKMAILSASLTAGTIGFLWLKLLGKPEMTDTDMATMDFEVTEVEYNGPRQMKWVHGQSSWNCREKEVSRIRNNPCHLSRSIYSV